MLLQWTQCESADSALQWGLRWQLPPISRWSHIGVRVRYLCAQRADMLEMELFTVTFPPTGTCTPSRPWHCHPGHETQNWHLWQVNNGTEVMESLTAVCWIPVFVRWSCAGWVPQYEPLMDLTTVSEKCRRTSRMRLRCWCVSTVCDRFELTLETV